MPFTIKEIKAFDNLYQQLVVRDELAEYQQELDALPIAEKKALALKLVTQCPENELNNLSNVISSLRSRTDAMESFYRVISQVWEIRKKTLALSDPQHPRPYDFLLTEFDADLYNEYKDFTLELLKGKEESIAQRLALSTPEDKRSELVRNAYIAFAGSDFFIAVTKAVSDQREKTQSEQSSAKPASVQHNSIFSPTAANLDTKEATSPHHAYNP